MVEPMIQCTHGYAALCGYIVVLRLRLIRQVLRLYYSLQVSN